MKEEQAYKHIKNMIIQGKFTVQEAININQLAERMNMSRTPVHKALAQLEREGYLTITPQVGVFVRRPDHKEILERLQLCVTIDVFLAEQAARQINDWQLEELRTLIDEMKIPDLSAETYNALNVKFHTVICQAANNHFAFQTNKINWDYLNYVNITDELFQDINREQSQAEHKMIFYALKDHDTKLTELLMKKHLMRVAHFISEKYKQINA